MADWWGPLCFVPEERVIDRLEDPGWVPDVTPVDDVNAWKPLDFLFSPLRDDVGDPVGVLAVDLPADGLRPDEDRQRLLQRYAEVLPPRRSTRCCARERLTERLRLAETARSIVRTASAQLNLDRILADCQAAIVEGFGAQGLWIQTFDDLESAEHGVVFSSGGDPVVLPGGMIGVAHAVGAAPCGTPSASSSPPGAGRRPRTTPSPRTSATRSSSSSTRSASARCCSSPWAPAPECLGLPGPDPPRGRPRVDPGRGRRARSTSAATSAGRSSTPASSSARRSCSQEMRELDGYKSQLDQDRLHEFKNPLTSIVGHLELLESVELDPMEGRSLEVIARNTGRLQRLRRGHARALQRR